MYKQIIINKIRSVKEKRFYEEGNKKASVNAYQKYRH